MRANKSGYDKTIFDNYWWWQNPVVRYNNYPAGLGKGMDAAVVGAWLDEELTQLDPASVAARMFRHPGLVESLCIYVTADLYSPCCHMLGFRFVFGLLICVCVHVCGCFLMLNPVFLDPSGKRIYCILGCDIPNSAWSSDLVLPRLQPLLAGTLC